MTSGPGAPALASANYAIRETILEARGITKSFGGVHALTSVDLQLRKGEILGLAGDNAAGKSTLMKILYGVVRSDAGEILVEGAKVEIDHPRQAQALGIGMMFQDLALFNNLDVTANVFAGRELTKSFFGIRLLDNRRMATEAHETLSRLRIDMRSLRPLVERLSGGQRQMIAASRALGSDPRILLMDEPTAALGVREAAAFLEVAATLKSHGISVILVTHRIPDLLAIGDRIVVLKGGQVQGVLDTKRCELDDVVRLIVGGRAASAAA